MKSWGGTDALTTSISSWQGTEGWQMHRTIIPPCLLQACSVAALPEHTNTKCILTCVELVFDLSQGMPQQECSCIQHHWQPTVNMHVMYQM